MRALSFVPGLLALSILGCGAKTATEPSPARDASAARGCTEIGCVNGVSVDFTLTARGAYVIEVTTDGAKATCRASLPLATSSASPCDRDDLVLTLSGSALPEGQQSIGGLQIGGVALKSVTVRVTKDGEVLRDDTFAPQYASSTPNGPDCGPVCTSARHALQ